MAAGAEATEGSAGWETQDDHLHDLEIKAGHQQASELEYWSEQLYVVSIESQVLPE
jgi:hypothetical protein